MKKKEFVKDVIGFTASIGVGMIVANAVRATTPSTTGPIGLVVIFVGCTALGGLAGYKTADYVDKEFTNIDNMIKETKEKIKEEKRKHAMQEEV